MKLLVMCEGANEKAIVDILLENHQSIPKHLQSKIFAIIETDMTTAQSFIGIIMQTIRSWLTRF